VLKALAEQKDMTLGDLLEGIVLHAFEGKIVPFSAQTLKEIEQFKSLYGMTLKASTATTSKSAGNEVHPHFIAAKVIACFGAPATPASRKPQSLWTLKFPLDYFPERNNTEVETSVLPQRRNQHGTAKSHSQHLHRRA